MKGESNEKVLKGIIYSVLTESKFKPKIWVPEALSLDEVLRVSDMVTAYFSIEKKEDWVGKISILPVPIYKFLGLTYFFMDTAKIQDINTLMSLTILVQEEASNFFYQNIDKLKWDLKILAKGLNEEIQQRNLFQFYLNLLEFIERYQNLSKLTNTTEKDEDSRKDCVLLTYFDAKIGPKTFFCYPNNFLSEEQQQRLNKGLEQGLEEGLFIKSYPAFNALHLYFELKSELARGQVEMCLLSLVFEELPSKEKIDNISYQLFELMDKLYSKSEISLGFYEGRLRIEENLGKIEQMRDYLREWVIEVYQTCIKGSFRKSYEGEYARILMNFNRVALLEKLSEEPIELEKLKEWVLNSLGKSVDLTELLSPLINSNLAIKEETSGEDHIILLNGLDVIRISPINTLEKLKSFGSIYPDIYPDLEKQYISEIRDFFQQYEKSNYETVLLSSIIFNPINYTIISKLRKRGIYMKTDFKKELGGNFYKIASSNLKFLKNHNIITEIKADKEIFILLKTDIEFVKTIPKYIILEKKKSDFLPDPLIKISNNISKMPNQIKNTFKRWFS